MGADRSAAHNPFRADRIEALVFRGPSPAALWERLRGGSRRGLLVGPKGHGKTTLLEALEALAAAEGLQVAKVEARPEETWSHRLAKGVGWRAAPGEALFIEGLDMVPSRGLLRWTLGEGVVVATAHRPLAGWPVLHEHHTDRALLGELLGELVGDDAPRWRPAAEALFDEHGGDLRKVWRALYDRWAEGS